MHRMSSFILSFMDFRVFCQILAIVNNACHELEGASVSLRSCFNSFGFIFKSGIVGSCSSISNSLRNLHTVAHSSYATLHAEHSKY